MEAAMKMRGGASLAPSCKSPKSKNLLMENSSTSSDDMVSSSTFTTLSRREQVWTNEESSARSRMSLSSASMMKKKVTFKTEQSSSTSSDSRPARSSDIIINNNKTPCDCICILDVGCDVMANILSFLEPLETLHVLTLPLSKNWIKTFTNQTELWRSLCVEKPFHAPAEVDNDDEEDDDETVGSVMKFRIMYTSFIRCMRYLQWIKDEQQLRSRRHHHTRKNDADSPHFSQATLHTTTPPTRLAHQQEAPPQQQQDDSKKKRELDKNEQESLSSSSQQGTTTIMATMKISSKKPRYGSSSLTNRLLLLPSASCIGEQKNTTTSTTTTKAASSSIQLFLPYSCAVYSIINWMNFYSNVEGIQIKCLETLSIVLEHDEQQRIMAQRAGLLGHVILRSMLTFSTSVALQIASLHTLVLLARPIGGHEGVLFQRQSMTTSYASEIFGSTATTGGNKHSLQLIIRNDGSSGNHHHAEQYDASSRLGILLDSMRRFPDNELLQAMGCWSLVNLALIPAQRKELIVQHGTIQAITRAMTIHSSSAQVQHRALFALVNLVIPSSSSSSTTTTAAPEYNRTNTSRQRLPLQQQQQQALVSGDDDSVEERAILDASVDQIVKLVVLAMKTFCSSPDILNRACLVLRNLSLISDYHHILLFTPYCYEMLQYSETNFGLTDRLLQASASGTLYNLQGYLRNSNEIIRARFVAFTQEQHWSALERAYHEAASLYEHEQRLLSLQEPDEE